MITREVSPDSIEICSWLLVDDAGGAGSVTGRSINGPGLALTEPGRFYRAAVDIPVDGCLAIDLTCPRPLRLVASGVTVFDQPLSRSSFQRQMHGVVLMPVNKGRLEFAVEVGARPRHVAWVDQHAPSRNREKALAAVRANYPDRLDLTLRTWPHSKGPAVSLRFEPTQFLRDGVVYQHVLVCDLQARFAAPTDTIEHPGDLPEALICLRSSVLPRLAFEITQPRDRRAMLRRFAVPVAEPGDMPSPLRDIGLDTRPEPAIEISRRLTLEVSSEGGTVSCDFPAYESLGRLAPRREWRTTCWPTSDALLASVPQLVLAPEMAGYGELYQAAWQMLLQLVREPPPESGAVNSYISTGAGFGFHQFVWDTSFTVIAAAYGWRVLPVLGALDNLYTRQFDGGYIHREHDWTHGLPSLFEPDFGPNPPLMALAEWQIARLSGNILRLREVYPLLKAAHQWICHNRRLPDGTYWTTGLANGLDNSPSLGDGYPDLSAQMAHDAETLSKIASVLGYTKDASEFADDLDKTALAINGVLWDESSHIYSTSLPGGGHNPNKVVTAFWPLYAGVVPEARVEDLAGHLLDPNCFWRHHPIPSLSADSPHYRPPGDYWRGSVWAPTNYAAIKGFNRCGRHALAVRATRRHLDCMHEVWKSTGQIWENYSPEKSERGSWSGSPYSWSALGPIALLLEVVIGIEADAISNTVTWTLPELDNVGVDRFAFGANTLSLVHRWIGTDRHLNVRCDFPFKLEVIVNGIRQLYECAAGQRTLRGFDARGT